MSECLNGGVRVLRRPCRSRCLRSRSGLQGVAVAPDSAGPNGVDAAGGAEPHRAVGVKHGGRVDQEFGELLFGKGGGAFKQAGFDGLERLGRSFSGIEQGDVDTVDVGIDNGGDGGGLAGWR